MSTSYPKKVSDIDINLIRPENENETLEEELGLDTDLEDVINASIFTAQNNFESSFISKPYFTFDMGEPKNVNAEFVYNYFQKDERENVNSTEDFSFALSDYTFNTTDLVFQSKTENLPRYVSLNIFGPNDVKYQGASNSVRNLGEKEDIINAINVEASNSTPFFTGFEIFDVDIEGNVYSEMKNNGFSIFDNPAFLSFAVSSDNVDQLADALDSTTIFNTNSKDMIKSIMNIKNSGYAMASSDVNPQDVEIYKRRKMFSGLNFSIKCANLFFGDIYKRAIRTSNNVFDSENRGISQVAESKTSALLSQLSTQIGSSIFSIEFDPQVDSIEHMSSLPFMPNSSNDYSICHIGYLILKEETLQDGSLVKFEPILRLTDLESISIIDPTVRYGGFYTYIVRSIYEVIAPAYDPNDGESYGYEKFLLASEGVTSTVNCIETTAPPPPAAIRGGIEFKHRVPRVSWQFPVNPQRDIKRFQVFKRDSIDLPFTLVAEYNFDDSTRKTSVTEIAQSKNLYNLNFPKLSFVDYKYVDNSNPIYAIASVDAHGLTSNLSTQISIKYNKYLNKADVKMVSREGAPKPYPNIYIEEDTFLDAIKISNMDRMSIFFDPEYFIVKKKLDQTKEEIQESGDNEISLNLISANPNKETYKIQIVNLDMAKSKIINIKVSDKHSNNLDTIQKVSSFNEETLNFT